jgi:hypothetical protein
MTGLCGSCIHAKEMRSDRASVFLFCMLSKSLAGYPKYPRLPVLDCEGFQERAGPVDNTTIQASPTGSI